MTDWPKDESRIDVIGQNGPTGEHYKELNQPMKSPAKVKQLNEDQINITKIYLENKNNGRIAK